MRTTISHVVIHSFNSTDRSDRRGDHLAVTLDSSTLVTPDAGRFDQEHASFFSSSAMASSFQFAPWLIGFSSSSAHYCLILATAQLTTASYLPQLGTSLQPCLSSAHLSGLASARHISAASPQLGTSPRPRLSSAHLCSLASAWHISTASPQLGTSLTSPQLDHCVSGIGSFLAHIFGLVLRHSSAHFWPQIQLNHSSHSLGPSSARTRLGLSLPAAFSTLAHPPFSTLARPPFPLCTSTLSYSLQEHAWIVRPTHWGGVLWWTCNVLIVHCCMMCTLYVRITYF